VHSSISQSGAILHHSLLGENAVAQAESSGERPHHHAIEWPRREILIYALESTPVAGAIRRPAATRSKAHE